MSLENPTIVQATSNTVTVVLNPSLNQIAVVEPQTGSTIVRDSVIRGPAGTAGADGPTGPSGPAGPQGPQGVVGPQGPAGLKDWTVISSNYTATNRDRLIANTSNGSFTVTLPSTANTGDYIQITDGDDWYTNNLNIDPGAELIEGRSGLMYIPYKGITVELIYSGTEWQVTATIGARGPTGTTGTAGPTGPQGPQGVSGPQGPSGASVTGPQGPQGVAGPQGPSGPAGSVGDLTSVSSNVIPSANNTYNLGSPQYQWKSLYVSNNTIYIANVPLSIDSNGIFTVNGAPISSGTGPQGPQGAAGSTGPQGPQGPAGSNGSTGPQGPQGATGSTGPQGPSGASVTGPQGPQGPSGASVTGPQGPQGPSGPSGPGGGGGGTIAAPNTAILFANVDTAANGTNNFVFNVATNFMGVGTNTPNSNITVTGNIWVTTGINAATINITTANVTNVNGKSSLAIGTGTASNGNVLIAANGTEWIRLTNVGRVGFGTTTPNSNIAVVGNVWVTTGVNAATLNVTTGNINTAVMNSVTSVTANLTSGNVTGSLSVGGTISLTGATYGDITNANAVFSNAVYLTGNSSTGVNAVIAGVSSTILPNTVASFAANANAYTQVTFQNKSAGTDATADYILTADNGNDNVNYVDLGIIGSGYDPNTPTNSLGNIIGPADGYLYAQGNTSNVSQSGGNLAIGTTVAGKVVKIFAGGANSENIIATISNTGINVANGSVTMPNRVAFRVYGSGTVNNLTTTQNGDGTLNANNFAVDFQQGSSLNTSSGIFTAPVAGLYQLNIVGRNSGYTSGISQLIAYKNAGAVAMIEWAANSSMNHAGASTIVKLAVNDTLKIKVGAGQINFVCGRKAVAELEIVEIHSPTPIPV